MKVLVIFLLSSSIFFIGSSSADEPFLSAPRSALRNIYTAEIGVREASGRNDGPRVEEYLRYTHLKPGNPWCAAFVCWCLGQAGVPNPRTGYCPNLFPKDKVIWSRSSASLSRPKILSPAAAGSTFSQTSPPAANTSPPKTPNPPRNPIPGDIFGIYFPEKGRIAHVGFVDQWDGKWLITVEGNTNESGSREGDGVYRKRRLVSSISKVSVY